MHAALFASKPSNNPNCVDLITYGVELARGISLSYAVLISPIRAHSLALLCQRLYALTFNDCQSTDSSLNFERFLATPQTYNHATWYIGTQGLNAHKPTNQLQQLEGEHAASRWQPLS